MTDNAAVLVTGGMWSGCLGVVLYKISQPRHISKDIWLVMIDRLGQVAVSADDMKEIDEQTEFAPDFEFLDPQVKLAQMHLDIREEIMSRAMRKFEEAMQEMERCRNGGYFNRAISDL